MRNRNYLFISRSEKESHRGYSAISQEDRLIFFCFDYLPPLFATSSPHYPKVTKVVSPLHALFFLRGIKVGNPEREWWAHLARSGFAGFALSCSGSQSEHRIRLILLEGAASDIIIYYKSQMWVSSVSLKPKSAVFMSLTTRDP